MKLIALTQGKSAIVDDEDYDFLMQWKWHITSLGYACRREKISKGKYINIWMHREIAKTSDGMVTDHINCDTIDNQKNNLRCCTQSQNLMNQRNQVGKTSKFKGVSWCKTYRKWNAKIQKDRKQLNLGYFSSEEAAANAYNSSAKSMFTDFSRINKVV